MNSTKTKTLLRNTWNKIILIKIWLNMRVLCPMIRKTWFKMNKLKQEYYKTSQKVTINQSTFKIKSKEKHSIQMRRSKITEMLHSTQTRRIWKMHKQKSNSWTRTLRDYKIINQSSQIRFLTCWRISKTITTSMGSRTV